MMLATSLLDTNSFLKQLRYSFSAAPRSRGLHVNLAKGKFWYPNQPPQDVIILYKPMLMQEHCERTAIIRATIGAESFR